MRANLTCASGVTGILDTSWSTPGTQMLDYGLTIDGRKGTPASCTTPVEPGMKVHTQTDKLAKLRKGVMSCAGNELKADDVVYTFAWATAPDTKLYPCTMTPLPICAPGAMTLCGPMKL